VSTAAALTARRGDPLGAAATVTAVTTWAVGVVLYLVLLSLLLLRLLVVPVRPRQMTTLLVVFGFWRDVLLRDRPDSAPELWTLVFPLRRYSTATAEFGDVEGARDPVGAGPHRLSGPRSSPGPWSSG
jgi:hypothetical protein